MKFKEIRDIPTDLKAVTVISTVALFIAVTALLIAMKGSNGAS